MWECPRCSVNVYTAKCHLCGCSAPYEQMGEEGAQDDESGAELEKNPITCPRCRRQLDYVGTKAFHEGTRWGVLGDLGELFVNKERFDVYCCPRCGRVEFFVDGIGEQFRPQ